MRTKVVKIGNPFVAIETDSRQLFHLQGKLAEVSIEGLSRVNSEIIQDCANNMAWLGAEYAKRIRMVHQRHESSGNIIDDALPIRIPPGVSIDYHHSFRERRYFLGIDPARIVFKPVDYDWCCGFALAVAGVYNRSAVDRVIESIMAVNSVVLDYFLDYPDTLPKSDVLEKGTILFCGTVYEHSDGEKGVRFLHDGKYSSNHEELWPVEELTRAPLPVYIACLKH